MTHKQKLADRRLKYWLGKPEAELLQKLGFAYEEPQKQKCQKTILCTCQRYKCVGREYAVTTYVRRLTNA